MFTGIIQEIGNIKSVRKTSAGASLTIHARRLNPKIGASVAVNGVCLTITKKWRGGFVADIIPETISRTNLGHLKNGAHVNLESSLKWGDEIGGHLVTGHVNERGAVLKKGPKLEIKLPQGTAKFLIKKGSVAVNGVSLTIVSVRKNSFTCAITPFTLKNTNLGILKKNELVNIEIDPAMAEITKKNQNPQRIGIVISEFNKNITDRLLQGALQSLKKHGISQSKIDIIKVPGAFEIPHAIQKMLDKNQYRGVIALGCVIRGETDHYQAVCDGVTFGLQTLGILHRVPVMFGVLMCRNEKQALKRAQKDPKKNKGCECVEGLMKML